MDDLTLAELLSDARADDPIGFETRCGEGWTRETWRQHFIDLGYGEEDVDG